MAAIGDVQKYTLKIVDGAELIESTISKKIKINPLVSYNDADTASRALAELSQGTYSDTSLITDISLNSMLDPPEPPQPVIDYEYYPNTVSLEALSPTYPKRLKFFYREGRYDYNSIQFIDCAVVGWDTRWNSSTATSTLKEVNGDVDIPFNKIVPQIITSPTYQDRFGVYLLLPMSDSTSQVTGTVNFNFYVFVQPNGSSNICRVPMNYNFTL